MSFIKAIISNKLKFGMEIFSLHLHYILQMFSLQLLITKMCKIKDKIVLERPQGKIVGYFHQRREGQISIEKFGTKYMEKNTVMDLKHWNNIKY